MDTVESCCFMDWLEKILCIVVVIGAATHGAYGDAMVTGTVFCDQCRDGQISLFDYPLYGIKVAMACPGSDGQPTVWGEETTNWLGHFTMRFDGTPDLSSCYAQVTGNGQGSSGCGAVAGPAKSVRLMFRMFDTEMFTVDPLLSQPAQPMSYCPRTNYPQPGTNPPVTPPPTKLPPSPLLPPLPRLSPTPPMPHLPPTPPMPYFPPTPPIPFMEASACPYKSWTSPEHKCYWKVVTPDTKVAVVFGLVAARKYGTDMTLWQAMQGRGEPYKTLLRESTTALLNSYNSLQFPYHPLGVIENMNLALMGSTRQVLHTALSFMRANSGNGKLTCKFTACK